MPIISLTKPRTIGFQIFNRLHKIEWLIVSDFWKDSILLKLNTIANRLKNIPFSRKLCSRPRKGNINVANECIQIARNLFNIDPKNPVLRLIYCADSLINNFPTSTQWRSVSFNKEADINIHRYGSD